MHKKHLQSFSLLSISNQKNQTTQTTVLKKEWNLSLTCQISHVRSVKEKASDFSSLRFRRRGSLLISKAKLVSCSHSTFPCSQREHSANSASHLTTSDHLLTFSCLKKCCPASVHQHASAYKMWSRQSEMCVFPR